MNIQFVVTCLLFFWSNICAEERYLHRKSSFPYLSGDTFRFFADWRLSTHEHFSPEKVQVGDVIFVEHNYLSTFEKDYLPKIIYPIVLLTAYSEFDSDVPLPGIYTSLAESKKVGCWFVTHLNQSATEKIQPIPLGICNSFHPHGNTEFIAHYAAKSRNDEKTIYAFANFRIGSNEAERMDCWNYFVKQPFVKSWYVSPEAAGRSQTHFWEDMSRSVFVISPAGAGVDTFRTWKALLLGSYPIVKSSFLNPLYEDLPVVIVQHWEEVTKELLDKKLEEFKKRTFALEKLYAPYWLDKIKITQNKIRLTFNQDSLAE